VTLAGQSLGIGYSSLVVGRELDINLAEGEVLALLGPNGSGKTTLLKTLLGILPPLAGAVLIDGRPLAGYSASERARRIAYVPQSHVPTFGFSVETVVRRWSAPPCRRSRTSRRQFGISRRNSLPHTTNR
jgi:iron complex transport system ATP-binding protein